MNDEAAAQHPEQQRGMRIKLSFRDNALWTRQETYFSQSMLLMHEYLRVSRECFERGLPQPEPLKDDPKNRDQRVVAVRVVESMRPLLPVEIALQSRNRMSDE
jgi:hypothetical protein